MIPQACVTKWNHKQGLLTSTISVKCMLFAYLTIH